MLCHKVWPRRFEGVAARTTTLTDDRRAIGVGIAKGPLRSGTAIFSRCPKDTRRDCVLACAFEEGVFFADASRLRGVDGTLEALACET